VENPAFELRVEGETGVHAPGRRRPRLHLQRAHPERHALQQLLRRDAGGGVAGRGQQRDHGPARSTSVDAGALLARHRVRGESRGGTCFTQILPRREQGGTATVLGRNAGTGARGGRGEKGTQRENLRGGGRGHAKGADRVYPHEACHDRVDEPRNGEGGRRSRY